MYNNTANIKDYVTLILSEADENPSNGIYRWLIPTTYYTNQRSKVCTVRIVNANLTPTSLHNSILIDYANGGLNSYNKKQRHVIGHAKLMDHSNKSFYINDSKIYLLTNARPDSITLKFIKESDAQEKLMANGAITLEFCYYNAESTNESLHNQFTNTLK